MVTAKDANKNTSLQLGLCDKNKTVHKTSSSVSSIVKSIETEIKLKITR